MENLNETSRGTSCSITARYPNTNLNTINRYEGDLPS